MTIVRSYETDKISLMYSLCGGEYVVSAFPVVDGEPDCETEIFFRGYLKSDLAARVYVAMQFAAEEYLRVLEAAHRFAAAKGQVLRFPPTLATWVLRAAKEAEQTALNETSTSPESGS